MNNSQLNHNSEEQQSSKLSSNSESSLKTDIPGQKEEGPKALSFSKEQGKVKLEQTSLSSEHIPLSSEHIPLSSEQISVSPDQSSVISGQPGVSIDQPVVVSIQPMVLSDKPTVTSGQPEVSIVQPSASTEQPSVSTDKPLDISIQPIDNSAQPQGVSEKSQGVSEKSKGISHQTIGSKDKDSAGTPAVSISREKSKTVRRVDKYGIEKNIRIRPKMPQAGTEANARKELSDDKELNEIQIQRRLEFLEKYEKIRRTIPKGQINRLYELKKFKSLLIEYPEFSFPGSWRLEVKTDPVSLYHDRFIERLKEEVRGKSGKKLSQDSMPKSMESMLLVLNKSGILVRSKLIELTGIGERTFARTASLLKGLGFIKKIRTGNIYHFIITENGKSFVKSIGSV